MAWFAVFTDNGKVVLEVFPRQPGGCTVHLPPAEAEALAKKLLEAVKENDDA